MSNVHEDLGYRFDLRKEAAALRRERQNSIAEYWIKKINAHLDDPEYPPVNIHSKK